MQAPQPSPLPRRAAQGAIREGRAQTSEVAGVVALEATGLEPCRYYTRPDLVLPVDGDAAIDLDIGLIAPDVAGPDTAPTDSGIAGPDTALTDSGPDTAPILVSLVRILL